MKPWFIGALLFISFQKSKQFDNGNNVNNGASTSRQDLEECRECEISNYANEMIRLLLAQDSRTENLIDMVNNRPEELDAFHDEVFSYINLVRVGTTGISEPETQETRLETLTHHAHAAILETFFRTCTQHYTSNIRYDYDTTRRSIIIRENINVNSGTCLCGQFDERNRFTETFSLPAMNRRLPIASPPVIVNPDDTLNTQYNIIPLELIMRFFRSWLMGTNSDDRQLEAMFRNNTHRTGPCVRTLFGRLRRSLQKLVLARLRRSGEISGVTWNNLVMRAQTDDDDNFYSEIFAHARSWLGGNIFLGPAIRRPNYPSLPTEEIYLINAFDYDAEHLIPHDHYMELTALFYKLMEFVNRRSQVTHFWRLTEGFTLFVEMCYVFIRRPVTQTTRNQWTRHIYWRAHGRDLYWVVNKSRFQRSTSRTNKTLANSKSIYFGDQWKDFVSILKFMPIEESTANENLSWDCKFSLLYSDYLFNKKHLIKNVECPQCTRFDEYLYSKISVSNDWKKCNDGERVTGDWCEAWRNVTKDSGIIANYLEHYKNKYTSSVFELDLEILVNWLYKKSGPDAVKESEKKSNVLHDQTDLPSKIICILTTFTMNVLTGHNDCFNIFNPKSLKPVRTIS